MSASERRTAASAAARGSTTRRISGKVAKEALVDAGIEMPCEHVGIEHVPGTALPHHGADPRLGAEQAFGNERLHALAQHRPRHPNIAMSSASPGSRVPSA